jgi:hypothetical protein
MYYTGSVIFFSSNCSSHVRAPGLFGFAEAHEELAVKAPSSLVQRDAVLGVDDFRPTAPFLVAWLLGLDLAALAVPTL